MHISPLSCLRPTAGRAAEVAALPYDVYDRFEARTAVAGKPLSFLNIDRPETQFPPDQDMYAPEVYAKARELLDRMVADDVLVEDVATTYYLYRLEAGGRAQTGFVGLCPVDGFLDGTVKKHENTRPEKEQDRVRHIEALEAQTGPVFLAFRPQERLKGIAATICGKPPLYTFASDDGVTHTVWRVDSAKMVAAVGSAFEDVPCAYIADGHHRAAAAVRVALDRRTNRDGSAGPQESDLVLCVLFPADELAVLPYNRVVRDLGCNVDGTPRDHQDFISDLCRAGFSIATSEDPVEPAEKGTFGMYLGGSWWTLRAPALDARDPVRSLDASVLQERMLKPVLGIDDPRTDDRIAFVGGVRGTAELERMVDGNDWAVAFSMHPTSMDELLAVADAGLLMPPKSTWFEPKLRSGLFIHRI